MSTSAVASDPATSSNPATQRITLAAAHRLAHHFGMTDLIHTHISSRLGNENEHFLITPYGKWFHEVTANNLSKVNNRGELVGNGGGNLNPAGFIVHEAIYSARTDVTAVFHTHTTSGVAVSAMATGLRFISQYAMRFYGQVAYHDYQGATLVEGERDAIREAVSDPAVRILILRNHGVLTMGASIPEAFMNMYFLDRACEVQMHCQIAGGELVVPDDEICRLTARQFAGKEEEDMIEKLNLEWSALLRLIENQREHYHS